MPASLRLGGRDLTLISDGVFEAPASVLRHAGGEGALRALLAARGERGLRLDVNCFLLRGPEGVTLIDAGTGDAWGPALGQARAALAAEGVAPDRVDRVLLTHIHGDHALGLLEGEAAWLPRAELLIPAADLAYFTDEAARAALPEARRGGFDIAARLGRAYAGRIRAIPTGVVPGLPGIEALPLPGHTPGHSGYLLRGAPESLLIWADALHLWEEQARDPAVGVIYDLDPATARQSREAILARALTEGWIVTGSHVPGLGRLRRDGAGYAVLPLGG